MFRCCGRGGWFDVEVLEASQLARWLLLPSIDLYGGGVSHSLCCTAAFFMYLIDVWFRGDGGGLFW